MPTNDIINIGRAVSEDCDHIFHDTFKIKRRKLLLSIIISQNARLVVHDSLFIPVLLYEGDMKNVRNISVTESL